MLASAQMYARIRFVWVVAPLWTTAVLTACMATPGRPSSSSSGDGGADEDDARTANPDAGRSSAPDASVSGSCPSSAPTRCSGACVNLASSNAHCGACGNACETGEGCSSGQCLSSTPSCPGAAPTRCGGSCVDTQTDKSHCGSCGNLCDANKRCVAGACTGGSKALCDPCITRNCPAQDSACGAGSACNTFFDCANACTNQGCIDGCASTSPSGYTAYRALLDCLTASCPVECNY